MAIERMLRLTILPLGLVVVASLFVGSVCFTGCQRNAGRADGEPRRSADQAGDGSIAPTEASRESHLAVARRMTQAGDFDAAAEAASKALVQDPDNVDAMLIASEVEAARGNHQVSAELAAAIDIRSRLGKKAIEIRAEQLAKLGQVSEAADVILAGLEVMPQLTSWRHQAWKLLTRAGRREEASLQAVALCRAGLATEPQLLSLVRRTEAFPALLDEDDEPSNHFEPGLGMARWHFTQLDFRQALAALAAENDSQFKTAASCALWTVAGRDAGDRAISRMACQV